MARPSRVCLLLLAASTSACTYRLMPPGAPSTHTVRILSPSAAGLTLRVGETSWPVAPDGAVQFSVGRLGAGCRTFLFDRIPLTRKPEPRRRVPIEVRRADAVLTRLTLWDLQKLPLDSSGRRLLALRP